MTHSNGLSKEICNSSITSGHDALWSAFHKIITTAAFMDTNADPSGGT